MSMRRRDLLRGLGLSAAAVGLPSILASTQKARAGDECPLRFVIFYERHGYTQRFSRPRAPGQGDFVQGGGTVPGARGDAWELGPSFEPLAAYKSRIIQLAGMDMRSANLANATADGGGHGHHRTNALTASPRVSHNTPGGPSIDQYIADGLAAAGITTRIPSIAVGISGEGIGAGQGAPMFRPDGTPIFPLDQPPIIYDRLFPEELQASTEEQARRAARRTSAANLVQSLGSSLTARLSRDQRMRVESHLQLHRDLQARLGLRAPGEIPDRATTLGPWAEPLRWFNDPGIESLGFDRQSAWEFTRDVNPDLVAAALHADLTRVAVISSEWLPPSVIGFVPGNESTGTTGTFGTMDLHAFHHEVVDEPNLGDEGDRMMTAYHQETSRTLLRFLDRLQSLPEANGTTLLDNTIILVASEMADPAHRWQMLNWLVIGDGQGQFETNRAHLFDRVVSNDRLGNFGEVSAPTDWTPWNQQGPTHGQLFVTLANAMGVPTETFGDPSICPGPLDLG